MTGGSGSDSAGVPWEGRTFSPNPAAGDDGSADPALADALRRFAAGAASQAAVVDAIRAARLLVPLLAEAGDEGIGAHGQRVEKTQELSLVEIAGPDGRRVVPAFTSVTTLAAWRTDARPVPVDSRRLALAGGDADGLVVLDPGSPASFALRRGALRAIALDEPWWPAGEDPRIDGELDALIAGEEDVYAARALPGDAAAKLTGPELVVALVLAEDLDDETSERLLAHLARRLESSALRDYVDSMMLWVVPVDGDDDRA